MSDLPASRSIHECQYHIGALDVDVKKLNRYKYYKYVVRADLRNLVLYAGVGEYHRGVAQKYTGEGEVVGGGSLCLDVDRDSGKNFLSLEDYSLDFGGVPQFVNTQFRKIVFPILQAQGLNAIEMAQPGDEDMKVKLLKNNFWNQFREVRERNRY